MMRTTKKLLPSRRERVVKITGTITSEKGLDIAHKLVGLSLLSPDDVLEVQLDSRGGLVEPAMYIYRALRLSMSPTQGIVIGEALSAACIILQGCEHRVARRNARIHFHSPYMESLMIVRGNTNGVELLRRLNAQIPLGVAHLQVTKALMTDIIRKRTGQDEERILSIMDGMEQVFSAQEALEFGLIDEIA